MSICFNRKEKRQLNDYFLWKRKRNTFFHYSFLSFYAIIIIFPIFWVLVNSLKDNQEIFQNPWALPNIYRWSNYIKAWYEGNIGSAFFNSVIVTIISVVIVGLVASMAAYSLSRLQFAGKKTIFYLFLGGMYVAPVTSLIPLLKLLRNLNLVNTHWGLIFPYVAFALPLSIFIIRSYMLGIPKTVEEAAIVDGVAPFQLFWKIMFPLSLPSVYTVVILQIVYIWNEFLFALVFLRTSNKFTLPRALQVFQGSFITEFGPLNAAVLLAAIPTIIIYIIFSERIRNGMAIGFSSNE
ncbi:MAG TPA: carbohydrate ABC transporter permease [Firmicutes bacterium]|jgi:raffinose/stachyose/melibiose transport system permease protein|nr:carbohydrate ABC transporter permease [Bacillota bacterium]